MTLFLFLKGIIIGLTIAVPVGPVGILCISRTLAYGRASGLVSGLGAATADGMYGCLAGFGLAYVANLLVGHQDWIRLIGGLFLIGLGVRTFCARVSLETASNGHDGLVRDFVSTFFLTLTNPLTILLFAAVFAGLGIHTTRGDYGAVGVLILGVFCGSALWWLTLSWAVSFLRERMNLDRLRIAGKIAGIVIAAFGVIALATLLPVALNSVDPSWGF
jgi:threonine/homoserine/homoserine lactone efflux protein